MYRLQVTSPNGRMRLLSRVMVSTCPNRGIGRLAILVALFTGGSFQSQAQNVLETTPVREYSISTLNSQPQSIVAGPDGNLWFTEMGCTTVNGQCLSKIGRITPAGAITEFTIPTPISDPAGIAKGPDGNLWFAESQGSKIGRITPSGKLRSIRFLPLIPSRMGLRWDRMATYGSRNG